ncbi:hypothetical protein AB4520_00125 [Vibrio renipiscarius]|uniref:hypothetical protein n=1 Tax=Vibrio renipiscarius TaxID=1461322 RepID=UPI0035504DB3
MKFAKYWKKREVNVDGKLFGREKLSIWGASNESEEDASEHASRRLSSMAAFLNGDLSKSAEYEYWMGFVREEILEEVSGESGEAIAIISRNAYGASILNTNNIVFGDIDIQPVSFLDQILSKFGKKKKDKNYVLKRIETYQKNHPTLSFRVYETHSGIRFILTNKQCSPGDVFVKNLFKDLSVDPLYSRLCLKQDCFRARLTPKPWRIGITRPNSDFPRSSDIDEQTFLLWLREYQSASRQYTTTKYLASFGVAKASLEAQKIIAIHDGYNTKASKALA